MTSPSDSGPYPRAPPEASESWKSRTKNSLLQFRENAKKTLIFWQLRIFLDPKTDQIKVFFENCFPFFNTKIARENEPLEEKRFKFGELYLNIIFLYSRFWETGKIKYFDR